MKAFDFEFKLSTIPNFSVDTNIASAFKSNNLFPLKSSTKPTDRNHHYLLT